MGKSAPKPPPAPDPVATANAQAAANKDAAIASQQLAMVDQQTPWGSLTYQQIGEGTDGTPRYRATQSLSPAQQTMLNQQQNVGIQLGNIAQNQARTVGNTLRSPLNFNGAPSIATNANAGLPGMGASVSQRHLRTTPGDAGAIESTLADRGLRTSVGSAGTVRRTVGASEFGDDRARVEQALFDRMTPQIDRDREAMETRLATQGIQQGSEAYTAAMDDFSRGVNDARLAAIANAGNEQSRMFGMDVAAGQFQNQAQQQQFGQNLADMNAFNQAQAQAFGQDLAATQFANQAQQQQFGQNLANMNAYNQAQQQTFGQDVTAGQFQNAARAQRFNENAANAGLQNAARQQYIQEYMLRRNQPLNETAALMSGQQVNAPQFAGMPTAQVAPADVTGAIFGANNVAQNNYAQQVAAQNANTQGLFGIGSALAGAIPWSDRRLKRDIRRVGTARNGLPLYTWKYVWGQPGAGVMADEVREFRPWAVFNIGGYDAVNYAEALR